MESKLVTDISTVKDGDCVVFYNNGFGRWLTEQDDHWLSLVSEQPGANATLRDYLFQVHVTDNNGTKNYTFTAPSGLYISTLVGGQANYTNSTAGNFTIATGTGENLFTIQDTGGNNLYFNGSNSNFVGYTNVIGANSQYKIYVVNNYFLTIGSTGYATLNLPFAVELPEAVAAYGVESEKEGVLELSKLSSQTLPANSPVLIAGTEGTYSCTILTDNVDEPLSTGFAGTLAPTEIPANVDAYVLAKKAGEEAAKFYELADQEYYHLTCAATTSDASKRRGRVMELVCDGSSLITDYSATVGQLWSNATSNESNCQLWKLEQDPSNSGKYAIVCKAYPSGSVKPNPTADALSGRWEYDNETRHYNFELSNRGTDNVGDYYCISSDQSSYTYKYFNFGGSAQNFAINAYQNPDDAYQSPCIRYVLTDRIIGANKAYYVGTSTAAQAFAIKFGGQTTGIDSAVTPDETGEETEIYYDLSGRRVLYPSTGIYVTGSGKKVFLK